MSYRPTDLEWALANINECQKSEDRDPPECTRHFTADEVEEMVSEIVALRIALQWIADHGDTGEHGRPAFHAMRAHARETLQRPVQGELIITDAHLETIYRTGYDRCAGPQAFRHSVNHERYHIAGLRAVVRWMEVAKP
jgi:hypothetical protein